jgi:hypothetical protein
MKMCKESGCNIICSFISSALAVTILFLSSCINDNRKPKREVGSFSIEIEESFENKQKVPLSSIASEVRYVMIEEQDQTILDRIYAPEFQIHILDNNIFVTDEKRLLRLDLNGNLLNEYGSQGRGPGEFINVKDFSVSEREETVMILCSGTLKMLKYKLDGTFIGEFKVPFAPFYFSIYNEKIIFNTPKGLRHLNDFYTLTITDWDGNILDRLIYREDEYEITKKEQIPVISTHNLFFSDSLVYYWEVLYDTIWVFNDEFELESKGFINFGTRSIHPVITESKLAILRDYSRRRIDYYIDAGDFSFFRTVDKEVENRIFYDKRTGIGTSLYFGQHRNDWPINSFKNDLDGLISFWPQGTAPGNRLYSVFYAEEIEKHIQKAGTDISGNAFAKDIITKINSNSDYRFTRGIMIVTIK